MSPRDTARPPGGTAFGGVHRLAEIAVGPVATDAAPIQMVTIELRAGKIKLPRLYQNQFELDQFIVADFLDDLMYIEANRLCNPMSIMWAATDGARGNAGFWDFPAGEQRVMATWAAADLTLQAQTARAQAILNASDILMEDFGAVLMEFANADTVRGVLAGPDHAVALLIAGGQVRVYDSIEGAVTFNGSLAQFRQQYPQMQAIYAWNSAVIRHTAG